MAPSSSQSQPARQDAQWVGMNARMCGRGAQSWEKQEVIIEKVVRNKRKCITIVKGLDLFGVKLGDASKKLGKKFATGASVVKGPTDKEQIDVQGDISTTL
ncbi:Translation machinery-associated protein 22 [Vitis vinifera]|uniref:Translation machinery-associated protein 22 n=1 Tax=Vitis vinifera TaxID=29760 RepID=A0A438EXE5_VITVI|nr:Translation machinery-associated protein 22 [Vitis vinifera]